MIVMSLISGLLAFPFSYAIQAYEQARFEFPLEESSTQGVRRIYKNNPQYGEKLKALPGSQIKRAMQSFLDDVGIRKDLIFSEARNGLLCRALGTNMFRKSDAAIEVDPRLYKENIEMFGFLMKHEISRIKYNDLFTIPLVAFICQFAVAVFGMCAFNFAPFVWVANIVGIASMALFSQWREAKADDFAIKNSSNQELVCGRNILILIKNKNSCARTTISKKIMISATGEVRLDIFHLSLTSRIQKIDKALAARQVLKI